MSEKILRDVWSVESDPADVNGSDVVSMSQQATLSTVELFAFSVSFGNIPTFRAGPTCIVRFHIGDWYSCNFSFVLDKALELVESPRMDYSSLATTFNRYSQSNSFEVFKSYSPESVLSLLNNPFGDYVIYCCGESVFLLASFLEQTLGGFCSFSLEFTSDFSISTSYSVKFFSDPFFTIAVCCNVFDAQINSEKIFWSERVCLWNFDYGSKIELSVSENKVGLSSDFVDSGFLIGTYQDWDFASSFECENGNTFQSFPRENARIVNYGSVQVKCWLGRFVSFVGISDFADGSYGHLSGEAKSLSDFTVNKVMKLPIIESFSLERYFGYGVAGFVGALHCLIKFGKLCFVWNEFNQKSLLHTSMECSTPYLSVISNSSPQLEQEVSSEAFS